MPCWMVGRSGQHSWTWRSMSFFPFHLFPFVSFLEFDSPQHLPCRSFFCSAAILPSNMRRTRASRILEEQLARPRARTAPFSLLLSLSSKLHRSVGDPKSSLLERDSFCMVQGWMKSAWSPCIDIGHCHIVHGSQNRHEWTPKTTACC